MDYLTHGPIIRVLMVGRFNDCQLSFSIIPAVSSAWAFPLHEAIAVPLSPRIFGEHYLVHNLKCRSDRGFDLL